LRKIKSFSGIAAAVVSVAVLTGCTVAEAGSPDQKNPVASSMSGPTQSAIETPTAAPEPIAAPLPEEAAPLPVIEDTVPKAFSWLAINGSWCSVSSDCLEIVDYGFDVDGERYFMKHAGSPFGCLRGYTENINYSGSEVLYCPAGTATPPQEFGVATVEEAVMNDDASRERIWFFQGRGADTYFRQ
jgi:hypothetical protein